MTLARWAVTGSLLVNLAFALIVVAASSAPRPAAHGAIAQCALHHNPAASPRPVAVRYLAALRMGWAIS
ncbi:MAG TPA: hypothetical protein VEU54_00615 [Steroidobacteraceae bacterium]|nr:hypothetical protein [Steroidobacteraceae bacterium]